MRMISVVADLFAENAFHFATVEFDRSLIDLAGDDVDVAADQFSAAGFENQFGHAVGRRHGRLEIRAALETMRGVGVHSVAFRHAANRDRIPPRGFDQDVLRLLRDHGVESAHDAGERDRLLRVGDDQIFGSELAIDAIESLQRFARARFADDDLPPSSRSRSKTCVGLPLSHRT